MGTTKIQSSGTTQATPTPQEQQLESLQLGQATAFDPYARSMQAAGGQLATNLLTGNESGLPSFYQNMTGISPQAMASQANELTRQALPQFQAQGLLNSGTMNQDIQSLIAQQLAFPAAQFNIGAKQNLLNMALGGQAQVQQPVLANTGQLGANLAGLRTVTSSQQQTSNPFLSSFYSSLGSTLGGARAGGGVGGGWFGF